MTEYLPFPSLKPGHHIRILCTARIASLEKLEPAMEWLQSIGYKVSLGSTVGKKHHQYGGTDEERLLDFQEALQDSSVHAIWIARGGYGSIKIVDAIDLTVLKGGNKLLLGYSDVTNLHGLWQKNGLQSVHCFMPQEYPEKSASILESWENAVSNKPQDITIENTYGVKECVITAPITGGNLSVLISMMGSNTFPEMDGHILFIEDLDEYLYHIDRLMTTLRRAGKLDHLKALVVGGMTDMRDHDIPFGKSPVEIIQEHTARFSYPVIFDFPAGHLYDNYSFALGKPMSLKIEKKTITITQ